MTDWGFSPDFRPLFLRGILLYTVRISIPLWRGLSSNLTIRSFQSGIAFRDHKTTFRLSTAGGGDRGCVLMCQFHAQLVLHTHVKRVVLLFFGVLVPPSA